jgi:putative membrane-bound dehydrogenase-like protein
MKRLPLALLLLTVAGPWVRTAEPPAAANSHQVRLDGHTFTLPVGFEIERVAGPPLVNRPITADFDEQGRLYVADSSGTNDKVQQQLEQKPHRIVRLEDADGDGRFDKATVFADHMMFPEGTMWFNGSLYVSAPPSIWKLTDTDGDGVADQRVEWFQGKTLTGCANDLHGPYRGPDGWIYWCKGAFAKQTYERPGKPPFVTRAAHIFRARPDGSGLEPVMTGGMDNPVDVVFTPGGERIFTTTFLQHPGGGRRDGLIHAVYGGVYGKDHDPIYEHPWTGPSLMPVLTHMGPAAPCGLTRYESSAFGPEYRDNLFACQFNMHKVSRHVLVPDGATFKTRDEDFLVSDNIDFHPTDVIEDADGSLLVVNTGGWYKLCCPTSAFHKPDILGAVYRVRRTGAQRVDDPRGLKLAWATMTPAELAKLLDDPRPAVRRRSIESLAAKGAAALPPIAEVVHSSRSAEARRNAVWAATRIEHPDARSITRQAWSGPDETTRQVALHSMSLWRDHEALPQLQQLIQDPNNYSPNVVSGKLPILKLRGITPQDRRVAAEALGRIGDKAAVPWLLVALESPSDRVLEHSLTYALIEIADPEGTTAGLKSSNPAVRRAALVALDQMPSGGLKPGTVAAELDDADPALRETAWWIVSRHPEWGGALAGTLRRRLTAPGQTPAQRDELAGRLARFARSTAVQTFLAEQVRNSAAAPEACRVALKAMAQAGLRDAPDAWLSTLTHVLAGADPGLIGEAVRAARSLPTSKKRPADLADLAAALLHVAQNTRLPAEVRLTALAAVPGGPGALEPALFDLLRDHLDSRQPVTVRSSAADVFSRAKLTSEQFLALADSFKSVGPLEADRLLEAFGHSADENVGLHLLTALKESPARSSLRAETLRQRLAKYGPAVQKRAEELYAALDADAAGQKAKLEQLFTALTTGDIRRGQAVFHSTKAACSSCHAIGYVGGRVGPDLTRIGSVRSERDLLESIVFPSATFVRSYEPFQVATKDGRVFNGLIKKDAPDEVVLTVNADQEVRIARDDIASIEPSAVSIMPAGLDQQLSPQELADLVAFLKACK